VDWFVIVKLSGIEEYGGINGIIIPELRFEPEGKVVFSKTSRRSSVEFTDVFDISSNGSASGSASSIDILSLIFGKESGISESKSKVPVVSGSSYETTGKEGSADWLDSTSIILGGTGVDSLTITSRLPRSASIAGAENLNSLGIM
jgi:hypothetical protein